MSNYYGDIHMATNKPYGDNARKGAVRDRSQVYNPHTNTWIIEYLRL